MVVALRPVRNRLSSLRRRNQSAPQGSLTLLKLKIKMLLLLLIVSESAGKMDPFIVGGQKASIQDWPFIAFTEADQYGSVVNGCGGSLLSSQTVLTAAHCLDDVTHSKVLLDATTFTVFMGHARRNEATMIRKVLDYETHSNYDPENDDAPYDIGVMFLASPVTFSKYVKKVILQRNFNYNSDNQLAVAGWGAIDINGTGTLKLKSLDLRPVLYPQCETMYNAICTANDDEEFAFSTNTGCSTPDMRQILLILAFSSSVYPHNITSQMKGFIVGGQKVSIKHWPFITFIEAKMPDGESSACGGSLLSSQTVLTAAHCLDDMTQKKKLHVKYIIYMGHSSFKKSRMVRSVKDYETHSSYEPKYDDVRNDIGIMFLNRPVKFIHNVQKTILVNRKFNILKDKNLLVAGWGRVDTSKLNTISANLKDVKLRSISFDQCGKQIPFIIDIKKVVCAAPSHEFAYGGDSGGPLVQRRTHHQLGLVSFRNQKTGITVFTSVPAYYEWINRTNLNLYKKHCGKY